MSQPGHRGAAGRTPAPLRVVSERLTAEEARAASAVTTAPPASPVPHPAAAETGPIPATPPQRSGGAPVVARPSVPALAPRPRRRFGDLWRLVFARRRAGRHRPETTPPQGWSMFAPQRRRPPGRRWGGR